MNPNYNDEMADRALREYFEEVQEAHRDLDETMDTLKRLALDFSAGSQQRFLTALRDAEKARDYVWYLEHKRGDHE